MKTRLTQNNTKRLAIFASYDSKEKINDYVIYYLKELSKVSDIIFVADNFLSETEKEKIHSLTIHIIAERHGEYDFGSYKRGYMWADKDNILNHYGQLIFCNDSVFGPFYSFGSIFSAMEKRPAIDFWGIFMVKAKTEEEQNIRKKDHAQSYFMVFTHKIMTSMRFRNFMRGITKLRNKEDIIKEYEIGLSQALINEGFRCDGYMKGTDNAPHKKNALKLINTGFPFLKKSLFSPNYLNQKVWCYNLWKYKSVIAKFAPSYPLCFIEKYLHTYIGKQKLKKQFFKLRLRIPIISRFLFYKKVTKKGYLVVKVLSVIVYKRKQMHIQKS